MIWDLKKYISSVAAIDDNGNQITYKELYDLCFVRG